MRFSYTLSLYFRKGRCNFGFSLNSFRELIYTVFHFSVVSFHRPVGDAPLHVSAAFRLADADDGS